MLAASVMDDVSLSWLNSFPRNCANERLKRRITMMVGTGSLTGRGKRISSRQPTESPGEQFKLLEYVGRNLLTDRDPLFVSQPARSELETAVVELRSDGRYRVDGKVYTRLRSE